jgi:hypothetical protein
MATTAKERQKAKEESRQTQAEQNIQPKRLSKIGQWMLDNPGGIITVLDRRAVNR